MVVGEDGVARCWWAGSDPLLRGYHDGEWGRPVFDDRRMFEKICLEAFQSGLSWLTILRKRENFRRAFEGFDPDAVARFDEARITRLMSDPGIVRNRSKILATVNNARRCLELVDQVGSLAAHLWSFEPDLSSRPKVMDRATLMTLATSPESVAMSKDLRLRGWAFVGPTTLYAMMQSNGIVNDHLSGCRVGAEVERERAALRRPH